jgi:hypothetical protein
VRSHWNRIVHCGRDLPAPRELRRRLVAHPHLAGIFDALAVRSCREPREPVRPFGGVPTIG